MSRSVLCSAFRWVPGLGQAAESFTLLQTEPNSGQQLGCEEGGWEWSESASKLPLSLQFS